MSLKVYLQITFVLCLVHNILVCKLVHIGFYPIYVCRYSGIYTVIRASFCSKTDYSIEAFGSSATAQWKKRTTRITHTTSTVGPCWLHAHLILLVETAPKTIAVSFPKHRFLEFLRGSFRVNTRWSKTTNCNIITWVFVCCSAQWYWATLHGSAQLDETNVVNSKLVIIPKNKVYEIQLFSLVKTNNFACSINYTLLK